MTGHPLEVKVWGPYACFTRPEMKVERVSYTVMTPSAARGILEAIFWKPEFTWRVREILVLAPIRYVSFIRNEIKHRQTHLLESFTKEVLEPMDADLLQEFYDAVAVLEATHLDEILDGTADLESLIQLVNNLVPNSAHE